MGKFTGVNVTSPNRRSLGRSQRTLKFRRMLHPDFALLRIVAVVRAEITVFLGADEKDRQIVLKPAVGRLVAGQGLASLVGALRIVRFRIGSFLAQSGREGDEESLSGRLLKGRDALGHI